MEFIMDSRIQEALEHCNYRQTLNNQLYSLKVKADNNLIISKAGGSFKIDPSLISFLSFLQSRSHNEVVLLDQNSTPAKIDDIDEFLDEIIGRYFEVTNDYLEEYNTTRKARNVKKIINMDIE